MIYFVQMGTDGPVKVGYTKSRESLPSRVRNMQVDNPMDLRIRNTMLGDEDTERAIHQHLASCNIRGEWFYPTAEVRRLFAVGVYTDTPLLADSIKLPSGLLVAVIWRNHPNTPSNPCPFCGLAHVLPPEDGLCKPVHCEYPYHDIVIFDKRKRRVDALDGYYVRSHGKSDNCLTPR